jgi:hypothetical protein
MREFRLLFLLLSPLLLAFQCDEDEDVTFMYPAGSWDFVNMSGGIAGLDYDFPEGTIVWTFTPDGTISIVNNNENDNVEDFFETGTYYFSFVESTDPSSCSHVMMINETELGCRNISLPLMTYTQLGADGYVLTFKKIED